jgi:hypothetical protein
MTTTTNWIIPPTWPQSNRISATPMGPWRDLHGVGLGTSQASRREAC